MRTEVKWKKRELESLGHILRKMTEGTSGAQWTQLRPVFQAQVKKGAGPQGQPLLASALLFNVQSFGDKMFTISDFFSLPLFPSKMMNENAEEYHLHNHMALERSIHVLCLLAGLGCGVTGPDAFLDWRQLREN